MVVATPRNRLNSTYLSRAAADTRTRVRLKRNCHFFVRLVYPAQALRKLTVAKAVVIEISETSARIRASSTEIPNHFYIVLGNNEYSIGATIIQRSRDGIDVEFIKEQPSRFVNILSRVQFPLATIHDLKKVLGTK